MKREHWIITTLLWLAILLSAFSIPGVKGASPGGLDPGISYPPGIDTPNEQLWAVYSLIHQMDVEYNRVGAIARSDWKQYEQKWHQYDGIFKKKLLPLLIEQSSLQDEVRRLTYDDKQWASFDNDYKLEFERQVKGDKDYLQTLPTLATSEKLDQLKAVDFYSLNGRYVDPTETFTSATWNNGVAQSDSNSRLTIADKKVTAVAMPRNENIWFYRASSLDSTSDFEYLVELYWDANGNGRSMFCSVADFVGQALDTGTTMGPNLVSGTLYIVKYINGSSDGSDGMIPSLDTLYYLTYSRTNSGQTATIYIYDDADRTSLVDTLTKTYGASFDPSYLYAIQDHNTGSSSTLDFYIQNLDLQEAGEPAAENTPGSHAFGIIETSSHSATGMIFTVTNTGDVAIDVKISCTDATGGNDTFILSDTATPGENIYGLKSGTDTNYDIIVKKNSPYNTLVSDLATEDDQTWGLDIYLPTSVPDYDAQQMSATVTLHIEEH